MHNQFIDPWSDPEKDYLLALTTNGQVAATGRMYVNPVPSGNAMPTWRRSSPRTPRPRPGRAILTWMEARARQRLLEFPADLPRSLRTACLDYLADRIKLFEQHGFRPVRSWYRMRRDLSQPIPDEHLPPGLILRNYCPSWTGP